MSPSTARSKTAGMAGWRFAAALAVLAALAAYALLSHWLMVNAAKAPWAVAAIFGPLLLAVASASWQRRQALTLGTCAALALLLGLLVARGGVQDIHRMYVLQHGGIHLTLAWVFGLTLRPGSTPLITALAERLQHRTTPAMRAYTRGLTRLWTQYFGAMVLTSAALYTWAPWSWWSVFGNLFTPLSAVSLFVIEHHFRYRRHPEFERVSLQGVITAFRQHGRLGGVPPP